MDSIKIYPFLAHSSDIAIVVVFVCLLFCCCFCVSVLYVCLFVVVILLFLCYFIFLNFVTALKYLTKVSFPCSLVQYACHISSG